MALFVCPHDGHVYTHAPVACATITFIIISVRNSKFISIVEQMQIHDWTVGDRFIHMKKENKFSWNAIRQAYWLAVENIRKWFSRWSIADQEIFYLIFKKSSQLWMSFKSFEVFFLCNALTLLLSAFLLFICGKRWAILSIKTLSFHSFILLSIPFTPFRNELLHFASLLFGFLVTIYLPISSQETILAFPNKWRMEILLF